MLEKCQANNKKLSNPIQTDDQSKLNFQSCLPFVNCWLCLVSLNITSVSFSPNNYQSANAESHCRSEESRTFKLSSDAVSKRSRQHFNNSIASMHSHSSVRDYYSHYQSAYILYVRKCTARSCLRFPRVEGC